MCLPTNLARTKERTRDKRREERQEKTARGGTAAGIAPATQRQCSTSSQLTSTLLLQQQQQQQQQMQMQASGGVPVGCGCGCGGGLPPRTPSPALHPQRALVLQPPSPSFGHITATASVGHHSRATSNVPVNASQLVAQEQQMQQHLQQQQQQYQHQSDFLFQQPHSQGSPLHGSLHQAQLIQQQQQALFQAQQQLLQQQQLLTLQA